MLGPRGSLIVSSVGGLVGVMLGAFGAHALKERLAAKGNAQNWSTAVQYQLMHSLVLLGVSIMLSTGSAGGAKLTSFARSRLSLAASLFASGTLLFSGSIYGLCLLAGTPTAKLLGPTTPLGGLLLLGGWSALLSVAISAEGPTD